MGFFSELKNSITGGAADVTFEVDTAKPGESAPVTVRVRVASNSIEVARVYLLYLCRELKQVEESDWPRDRSSFDSSGDEATHATLARGDITLAGAQTLEAGQEYVFKGEIPIGAHLPASSQSPEHRIDWFAFAGLDMPGNDPDSGWQRFTVG